MYLGVFEAVGLAVFFTVVRSIQCVVLLLKVCALSLGEALGCFQPPE